MGRLIRMRRRRVRRRVAAGLREEGFIKPGLDVDPALRPGLPRPVRRADPGRDASASRGSGCSGQFQRINNPRQPTYAVALKLNLPPAYLLIHRIWLGGIGVLSQLGAEAPFRAILEEYLPGFAG